MGQANSMPSTKPPREHPPSRKIFMWLKRIGIGSGIFLILVIVTALGVQAFCTAEAIRRYPPPGRLVDVGGYRMHLQSAGSGSPTVVLDSGLGGGCLGWTAIQSEVAKFTCVISYDRAGLGWSERSPADRTSKQMAKELNTLLKEAGIPGPYILVGASLGGLNVRLFAHEYPDQVAGLVFVDSTYEVPEDQTPELLNQDWEDTLQFVRRWRFLIPFGIGRLYVAPNPNLPADLRAADVALSLRTPRALAACDELLNIDASVSQMEGCTIPPDIPLAVLSASKYTGPDIPEAEASAYMDVWTKCQADLASRSTNSFHLVVPDCGHGIGDEHPDVVIDAIRRVVESVRNKTKVVGPEL